MILHDAEAERAFTEAFEARFPYGDPSSASALIGQGWAISLNAAFCVLNELCRPPHPGVVAPERLHELVAEWAKGPQHPLKAPLLGAARALIEHRPLPWREGIALMERIGRYDGQRAALGIACFASDCADPAADTALERAAAEIRREWDARGV